MIPITRNEKTELQDLRRRLDALKDKTRRVRLLQGPFHGKVVRVNKEYEHFATSLPRDVAVEYPPLEFDGVPDVPEELAFVAQYTPSNSEQFVFEGIQVWKKVDPNKAYPFGFEKIV